MRRQLTLLTLLLALLVGMTVTPAVATSVSAAPAASHAALVHTNAHAMAFEKTKFLIHLGIAAFLIHYIYKKYKQGKLGRHHIFTSIKAAAAALIAVHELKVAYTTAKNSNSKTLHVLIAPISGLIGGFNDVSSRLRRGDTSTVGSVASQQDKFGALAGKAGYAVTDTAPSGFSSF